MHFDFGYVIMSWWPWHMYLQTEMNFLCHTFDCHHGIIRLSYLQRVTNEEVMRRIVTIPPAMQVICDARLRYFAHVAQSSSAEDRCRAISAVLKICPN